MAYPGSRTGEDHLIAVEVLIQNATIFVYLTSHKGDWPFLIRNDSGYHIKLGQTVSHDHPYPTSHLPGGIRTKFVNNQIRTAVTYSPLEPSWPMHGISQLQKRSGFI